MNTRKILIEALEQQVRIKQRELNIINEEIKRLVDLK